MYEPCVLKQVPPFIHLLKLKSRHSLKSETKTKNVKQLFLADKSFAKALLFKVQHIMYAKCKIHEKIFKVKNFQSLKHFVNFCSYRFSTYLFVYCIQNGLKFIWVYKLVKAVLNLILILAMTRTFVHEPCFKFTDLKNSVNLILNN